VPAIESGRRLPFGRPAHFERGARRLVLGLPHEDLFEGGHPLAIVGDRVDHGSLEHGRGGHSSPETWLSVSSQAHRLHESCRLRISSRRTLRAGTVRRPALDAVHVVQRG
jgi:hypothetical protein